MKLRRYNLTASPQPLDRTALQSTLERWGERIAMQKALVNLDNLSVTRQLSTD